MWNYLEVKYGCNQLPVKEQLSSLQFHTRSDLKISILPSAGSTGFSRSKNHQDNN
jgi:hypothetical protein